MYAPSKIGQFDLPVYAHQNVLGFDITVDHVFLVQILESSCHLSDILLWSVLHSKPRGRETNLGGSLLRKAPSFL
jgi:hypothetical protein